VSAVKEGQHGIFEDKPMIAFKSSIVKLGPFALGAVPLNGSRRLVAALRPLGFHEIEPGIKGVHTMMYAPETGTYLVLSDGGYTPLPAGWLLVAALCCPAAERRELARLIEVAP
jgi:hypothetical protein